MTPLSHAKESEEKSEHTLTKSATEYWFRECGLLAEERVQLTRSFTAIRSIDGFAEVGDKLVEFQIIHLSGAPTGILWLNEKTGTFQALGLPSK
jgi:hypothetical protein